MAKVTLDGACVKISFAFMYRLFALNGDLRIPLTHIIGIRRGTFEPGEPKRFRMPVIEAPSPMMAGIYISELGHTLWDVQNMEKSVAIYFTNETYFAAVVEVDNPTAVIDLVTQAIKNRG